MKGYCWRCLVVSASTAALLLAGAAGCKTQKDPAGDFTLREEQSMIIFGNEETEQKDELNLQTTGTSETRQTVIDTGDYQTVFNCRTLSGVGSELSFTLSGIQPGKPLTVEVEEIHQRADDHFSYSVYVNGQKSYYRTYIPSSDGPNHYFFEAAADVVGERDTVDIRIVSNSAQEIRFSRIWALSDTDSLLDAEGISSRMPVVLMFNEVPSNLDAAYLQSVAERYRCEDMYDVGFCWEIQYLQWGKAKTENYIDNILYVSAVAGVPVYLGINSWWSGTPGGMDGQGGMWQDILYHQITYDKRDGNGFDQWKITTPNVWGNNPWLTMNSQHFNTVRENRIRETVAYIREKTAQYAMAGTALPAVHVYTENEPLYWPISWDKYDWDQYPQGIGDFSPLVIEAAAADGVTMDPSDGMSNAEIRWLYKNLNTYISGVGEAMETGYQYNTVLIKDGELILPDDQLVDNAYTHAPIQPMYPNWDANQGVWENHILDSIHFGGEWNNFLPDTVDAARGDSRVLDYLVARGSYADINCERGGMSDFKILPQTYAYGAEAVVIYNTDIAGDAARIEEMSRCKDQAMPAKHYTMLPVVSGDFSKESSFRTGNGLVSIQGVQWDGRDAIPQNANGGSITYRIDNAAAIARGLQVKLSGKLQHQNAAVEVWAGTSEDTLELAVRLTDLDRDPVVDLSGLDKSAEQAYVQLRLKADGISVAAMSTVSLSCVDIIPREDASGSTDGHTYTYEETRRYNTFIQYRADTERLMVKYLERSPADSAYAEAYNLYQEHKYLSAYKAIAGAISETLPASYLVSGSGQLGKYPLSVDVADDSVRLEVTLTRADEEGYAFTLASVRETEVTLTMTTDSNDKYSLVQQTDGLWVLAKDADGTKASKGQLQFTFNVKPEADTYPESFEARAVSADSDRLTLMTQDTAVTDYSNSMQFNFASDAVVYTGRDGDADDQMKLDRPGNINYGDYLKIRLNEKGQIKEVRAYSGAVNGTITEVKEASVRGTLSNPFVTIRCDNGSTRTFEIGRECELKFPGAAGENILMVPVGKIGLSVGQTVTVVYSPYTVNDRTRALQIR